MRGLSPSKTYSYYDIRMWEGVGVEDWPTTVPYHIIYLLPIILINSTGQHVDKITALKSSSREILGSKPKKKKKNDSLVITCIHNNIFFKITQLISNIFVIYKLYM